MKHLIIALTLLTAVHAMELSTKTRLDKITKEVRRGLWVKGHDFVSTSKPKLFGEEELNAYYQENKEGYFEYTLDTDEISRLYQCLRRSICELWFFESSSEYHSGYGTSGHFILLYAKKHFMISHQTYSE